MGLPDFFLMHNLKAFVRLDAKSQSNANANSIKLIECEIIFSHLSKYWFFALFFLVAHFSFITSIFGNCYYTLLQKRRLYPDGPERILPGPLHKIFMALHQGQWPRGTRANEQIKLALLLEKSVGVIGRSLRPEETAELPWFLTLQ